MGQKRQMMVFGNWFKRNKNWREEAHALYLQVVEQARTPAFYTDFGVADTVDGRFDMVTLHMFLLQHRLKHEAAPAAELAEALMTVMASDMDRSLREMGVGDYSVGKRLKQMMGAFYGRAAAYENGLEAGGAELTMAVSRNVFREAGPASDACRGLATYIREQADQLASQQADRLLAGEVRFTPPPTPELAEEIR